MRSEFSLWQIDLEKVLRTPKVNLTVTINTIIIRRWQIGKPFPITGKTSRQDNETEYLL